MNRTIFLLFAIPVISIAVVAAIHFLDETFKKKFIIERRAKSSSSQNSAKQLSTDSPASGNRRFSDLVPAGSLRNTDPEASSPNPEPSETQAHGI